jgi:flavin-dependent dehydrogenase
MEATLRDNDVLIVGGGPAGSAAALTCARNGLRVVLVERSAFPRHVPGETLHPGVLPLLRALGVEDEMLAANFLRHEGHYVQWDGPRRFVPFGGDANGPWRGLQAWRPTFDALLLARARRLGVRILQPCRVLRPVWESGRVAGVLNNAGPVRATYTVDATGRRRWLAHQLDLPSFGPRHRLLAWYGYVEGYCPGRDAAPLLAADDRGWTWTACVRPGVYQWTRLPFNGDRPAPQWLPDELRGLHGLEPMRSADVSWRVITRPAGPGYFLTGDAAVSLDPASAHGVLRALMSGMMAGDLISRVFARELAPDVAAAAYTTWLRNWFEHDVRKLTELYSALGRPPGWVAATAEAHVPERSLSWHTTSSPAPAR